MSELALIRHAGCGAALSPPLFLSQSIEAQKMLHTLGVSIRIQGLTWATLTRDKEDACKGHSPSTLPPLPNCLRNCVLSVTHFIEFIYNCSAFGMLGFIYLLRKKAKAGTPAEGASTAKKISKAKRIPIIKTYLPVLT